MVSNGEQVLWTKGARFVPGHSLARPVITSVCALGVISKCLVLMDLCIWKINLPLQFRVMALLLQLYLISMVNYICFIFKSWSTSCYGAGKGWFTLASLERVPTARPCWASVPSRVISHLSSHQTGCSRFKTVSIVCTWLRCAEARRAVALGVRPV